MAKQLKSMDVLALLALRGKIDAILEGRRNDLENQLAEFEVNRPGFAGGRLV